MDDYSDILYSEIDTSKVHSDAFLSDAQLLSLDNTDLLGTIIQDPLDIKFIDGAFIDLIDIWWFFTGHTAHGWECYLKRKLYFVSPTSLVNSRGLWDAPMVVI